MGSRTHMLSGESGLQERQILFLLWLLMLGVRVACAFLDHQGLMMAGADRA